MPTGPDWHVVHGFTSGKRTVRGEPNPDLKTFDTVLAVWPDAADRVLGVRSQAERYEVLRVLRRRGRLVAQAGRLTHRVTMGNGRHRRMYVFPSCDHPETVRHLAEQVRAGR